MNIKFYSRLNSNIFCINKYNFSKKLSTNCHLKINKINNENYSKKMDYSSNKSNHYLFRNLFPWKTEIELAKYLSQNIVFNDYNLVAISKPWGLAIHKSNNYNNYKNNPGLAEQKLNSMIIGQSKFAVADVLDLLAQFLNVSNLYIAKSLNSNWSGLLILSTKKDANNLISKSTRNAKSNVEPFMKFYCIVNGIINNAKLGQFYLERCGVRLVEIDELGKFKEPVYMPPNDISNTLRKEGRKTREGQKLGRIKFGTVRYRILATNPSLAVSLVELQTTATKWSFIQCFLAYKASFVLGDTFFSYRVKHILGQPITMASLKEKRLENWRHLDQTFEPLSRQVCQALGVRSNREIPLMIHHFGLFLPLIKRSLRNKSKEKDSPELNEFQNENNNIAINDYKSETIQNNNDLMIETISIKSFPKHFIQTLDRLNLNIFS